MLQNIGPLEVGIVAVVVLLLFGAKKLPELARGIVNARKEFSKSFGESDSKSENKEKEAQSQ